VSELVIETEAKEEIVRGEGCRGRGRGDR